MLLRIAYEAYFEVRGGVAVTGAELPEWDDLPHDLRTAWRVAGGAVLLAAAVRNAKGECGMTRDVSGLMEPEAADEAPAVSRGEVPGEVWQEPIPGIGEVMRERVPVPDAVGVAGLRAGLEEVRAQMDGLRVELMCEIWGREEALERLELRGEICGREEVLEWLSAREED